MKTIDEAKLESDVGYRFQYLTEFMGFSEADIAAIHGAAPAVAPLVPALVDAVYDKLANYSATWRHFVPKQSGYDGAVPRLWKNSGRITRRLRFANSTSPAISRR